MNVSPEAVTAGRQAARDMAPRMGDIAVAFELCEEIADEVLDAAAPLITAAEGDRIRYLITDRRNEYAAHARQARALPKTAETLALRAETLSEVLDLLGGQP